MTATGCRATKALHHTFVSAPDALGGWGQK